MVQGFADGEIKVDTRMIQITTYRFCHLPVGKKPKGAIHFGCCIDA
jgi:hypothetical protein